MNDAIEKKHIHDAIQKEVKAALEPLVGKPYVSVEDVSRELSAIIKVGNPGFVWDRAPRDL